MAVLKNDERQEENILTLIIILVIFTMMKHHWRLCMRNGMNSSQSISRKNLIWESAVYLALCRMLMVKDAS